METKFLHYQSAKIYYRIVGEGKPLMLIHGFAEDGEVWKNQIAFLQNHCKLIVPDLPGSGKSALIEDMSIEGLADAIKAILLNEKITSCCIAGHSMGGYITLALAEKYQHMLNAFALVHSTAFADSDEKKANRQKSIEFVKKNGAFEFLKAVIADLFTESWYADNRNQVEELIERSKKFTDEAIIEYYQAMINRPDRTPVLKSFNKNILFIIGEQDNAVPFQQSLQQCHIPNQSTIAILRNSAHMGMWEEVEKVNTLLLELLKEN